VLLHIPLSSPLDSDYVLGYIDTQEILPIPHSIFAECLVSYSCRICLRLLTILQYYAYFDPSVFSIVVLPSHNTISVSLRSTHVEATLGLQQCMSALKDMEVRIWLNDSDES
jgi:hypothetical protein